MDETVKRRFDMICTELGLNMSTAFNIFAKTVVRQNKIPFELSVDPFWSEANQEHLRRVAADMDAGRNIAVHELIEADE